jgi:hypothetical protein
MFDPHVAENSDSPRFGNLSQANLQTQIATGSPPDLDGHWRLSGNLNLGNLIVVEILCI